MRRITVRDLHMKTGEWVRRAAEERIIVTERGRPVATLSAVDHAQDSTSFGERELVPEFAALTAMSDDSTQSISEDRDRA